MKNRTKNKIVTKNRTAKHKITMKIIEEDFHPNGQLKNRCIKNKNYKLHGRYEAWYDNGEIKEKTKYKKGKRHGLCKIWHFNKQLWEKSTYKNGIRHGLCEMWHSNGQIGVRTNYKYGDEHGLFETWDVDGTQISKAYYIYGKAVSQEEWNKYNLSLPIKRLQQLFNKVKKARNKLEKRLFNPYLFTEERLQKIEITLLTIMLLIISTGFIIAIRKLIEIHYFK